MASDPDSEIAKVERGQGYYRRQRDRGGKSAARGLLPLFLGEGESDALNCRARALALAVRQYDTTGRGVFVFSTSETGSSWTKPDLAVVEWPEGEWEGNALVFDRSALERRRMIGAPMMGIRGVCVACMPEGEEARKEFSVPWPRPGGPSAGNSLSSENCRTTPNARNCADWPPSSAWA